LRLTPDAYTGLAAHLARRVGRDDGG
jgi:hypothetical protein